MLRKMDAEKWKEGITLQARMEVSNSNVEVGNPRWLCIERAINLSETGVPWSIIDCHNTFERLGDLAT